MGIGLTGTWREGIDILGTGTVILYRGHVGKSTDDRCELKFQRRRED